MIKQIQKKSDKTFLVSADEDTWLENNKDAAYLTPSKYNEERGKLLNNYPENELKTKLGDKRNLKLTEEDIQIRLQEIQVIRGTNKFARIIKKQIT
jgi:hypothetical protein